MSDPLPAEADAKFASGLLYSWSLLLNNSTTVNLQIFASSYGSSVFSHVTRAPTERFSTQICFLVDLGSLYLIMKNRVKSVFFEVINLSATSMCSII